MKCNEYGIHISIQWSCSKILKLRTIATNVEIFYENALQILMMVVLPAIELHSQDEFEFIWFALFIGRKLSSLKTN